MAKHTRQVTFQKDVFFAKQMNATKMPRSNRCKMEPRLKDTILITNNKDKTVEMDPSRMTRCQEVLEAMQQDEMKIDNDEGTPNDENVGL